MLVRGVAKSEPFFDEIDEIDEIDESAEAAADAEGLAQLDAGKGISHAEVSAWLETWGTPDEKPVPDSWLK
jgi:predicted transcriptional regulator